MLNPLDYPVCLSYPLRMSATAWSGHVPFAMFLVGLLRPKTIVELGTFTGVSYCAFCQAVTELGLESRCYAVDTWHADPKTGNFGPEVLEDLRKHHDPLYGRFSTLIQSTFDEALSHFADQTIDLLHIDGYHTYEVVKRDFDNWLPKMSRRGVVLFHDINEREQDFGVWKLWEELKLRYKHWEFTHEHGLGVLVVGADSGDDLRELLELPESERILIRQFFSQLGHRLKTRIEMDHTIKPPSWEIDDKQKMLDSVALQLAQKDEAIDWLSSQVSEKELESTHRREMEIAGLGGLELAKQNEAAQARTMQELSSLAVEQQRTIDSLSAQVTRHLETVLRPESERSQKETLESYSAQADLKQAIDDRDKTISWLNTELAQLQNTNHQLAVSNKRAKAELAKTRQQIGYVEAQLAATSERLERVTSSLGWRLLSRYGRFKYRYLLPLYRVLGLTSVNPRKTEPPPESAFSSLATIEDEPLEDGLASQLGLPPAGASGLAGEPERHEPAQESGDFYDSLTLLPHLREEDLHGILSKSPPAEPLHRPDVICFSIIDWEFRYQRPQQIMSQFAARGHRVFYISTSRFLPSNASPRVSVSTIKENVYEVRLAVDSPPDVYGEVMEGQNREALLASLDELRRTYFIDDAIAYVMIASWGNVALKSKRQWNWRVIYDCMDEWENFPGIKRRLLDMEVELVSHCDLLVVTSQLLYEKWQEYNRPTALARNAVDWDFYIDRYRPNTLLPEIKHPVVGYYGAIAEWFDLELVAEIARRRPDYTFVLLGGVFDVNVSDLKKLANVHLLGQQPYETMPQYLYHFDVCIIPFKVNPITEATDPVKVYEYLSAGKPVVSIALPEIKPLADYLYIANGPDDFVLQIDKALAEDDPDLMDRRREFARNNTWAKRYELILDGIVRVTPRASVVVVTYNNLALNKLCIESIVRNTEYANYEVIVVDNCSTDGTPSYLRYVAAQYPNIHVILNSTNKGFARANNQGIERSTGNYIVLLNNDTIVPPGWLSRLLRHLDNPEIGLVGPVTNFAGNEARIDVPYHTWAEMEEFTRFHTWNEDGKIADIHMLAMFCVAFRRETFQLVGPLDEQFGVGMFEDDDYAHRIKTTGLRVVCAADVLVHHFGQAAFKKLIEKGTYNDLFEENRRRYETKWNVKWSPHKHGTLKFGTADTSERVLQIKE